MMVDTGHYDCDMGTTEYASDPTFSGSQVLRSGMVFSDELNGLPPLIVKKVEDDDICNQLSQPVGEENELTSSQVVHLDNDIFLMRCDEVLKSLLEPFKDLDANALLEEAVSDFAAHYDQKTRYAVHISMKCEPNEVAYEAPQPELPQLPTPCYSNSDQYSASNATGQRVEMRSRSNECDQAVSLSSPPPTFTVTVPPQRKQSKNVDYIMSEGTLFAKMDSKNSRVLVPFQLTFPSGYVDPETRLRITARFDEPTMKYATVTRCPNHVGSDDTPLRNYFMQTDDKYGDTKYSGKEEMNHLLMPARDSVNLRFTCFSSCSTINRKLLAIDFQLEGYSARPLISTIHLRVCANPSRDAAKELREKEKGPTPSVIPSPREHEAANDHGKVTQIDSPTSGSQFRKRPHKIDTNSHPPKKSSLDTDSEVFTIQIHGHEKYKKVMHFIDSLEKAERYTANKSSDQLGIPKPFECLTQIMPDTPVELWLRNLSLDQHAQALHTANITTMGDLSARFSHELFRSVGVPQDEADLLNKVFLNWFNVHQCSLIGTT